MSFSRSALFILLVAVLTACAGQTPTATVTPPPTVTRIPPSPYPTALTLQSPTTIPTYTPTLASSLVYTLFVLDISANMANPFGAGSAWDAARETAQTLLTGLEPGAQYGLVTIGGAGRSDDLDPCNQPSVVSLPFSSRSRVGQSFDHLQPAGGGSLYTAFLLARRQFEGLPADMVKTLVVITDGVDECPGQNEWLGLESLYKVMDKAGLEFHSEVIILNTGFDSQAVVERTDKASSMVDFRLAADPDQLKAAGEAALTALRGYAETQLAGRPTQTPDSLSFTFTPESGLPTNTLSASSYTLTPKPGFVTSTPGASSYTVTPVPGTPTFTPTITLTPTPLTATPTQTPTNVRTPTGTQAPTVELISASFRTTGIGCQLDITVNVSGSPATGSFHVLNAGNGPSGEVFQQVILPVGTYSSNIVALNGNTPETYSHELWFEFNGSQSNHLKNLKCPFLPTSTPRP